MRRYLVILFSLALNLSFGQASWWYGNAGGSAPAGPDTLTLTYWNDFVLLHIANTGITEDVNGVSEWQDRSGNGNHSTQSVNINKPSTDVDGNVVFDGTSDYLNMTSLFTSATDSAFTVFMVYEMLSTNTNSIMDVWNYADAYNNFILGVDSTTNANEFEWSTYYFEDNSGKLVVTTTDTGSINTTYLHTVALSDSTDIQVRIQGSQINDIIVDGVFDRTGVSGFYYMASNGTLRYSNIKIKFIGIASRKFTLSEIATTESELNSFFTIY